MNISENDGRIIGGEITSIRDFPHQVSLQLMDVHHCGGSIISEDWVLTAAHCVNNISEMNFKIRSGSSMTFIDGSIHQVIKIILHEMYFIDIKNRPHHDIALLKVNPKFHLNGETRQAIKLIDAGEQINFGTMAYVTGWGFTEFAAPSWFLKKVSALIQSPDKCDIKNGPLLEWEICAANEEEGIGASHGDSGGPLTVKNLLVGIVSWTENFATSTVYAKVAYYRDWIKKNSGI